MQGSRVRPIWSTRLWKSPCDSTTDTLGPYRGLNQSEIVKGGPPPLIGRGPDIPVRVCTFENACAAAVRQRGVSSRDARSVANVATFQTPRVTFFPKKRLVTNLATSWTNFSESLWSLVLPQQREISTHTALSLLCSVSVWEEQAVQLKEILLLL